MSSFRIDDDSQYDTKEVGSKISMIEGQDGPDEIKVKQDAVPVYRS